MGRHWPILILCAVVGGALYTVYSSSPGPCPLPVRLGHSISSNCRLQHSDGGTIQASPLPSLRSLMEKSGTDKLWRHVYDRYYEVWMARFRHLDALSLLEIGADTGNSMVLWADYFTNPSAIHGISYENDKRNLPDQKKLVCYHNPRACDLITIFTGDQSDQNFLRTFSTRRYDIIIDDGSHVPEHVIFSFMHLFSLVKPGGMYIVEDLETSYWDSPGATLYGYGISAGIGASPKVNAVEKFKQLIDVLMRYSMSHASLSVLPADHSICSITFGMNVAAIYKCTVEEAARTPKIGPAPVDHAGIDAWQADATSTNPQL